jgi:membrane protein implicated in regulation of membrane protease activity
MKFTIRKYIKDKYFWFLLNGNIGFFLEIFIGGFFVEMIVRDIKNFCDWITIIVLLILSILVYILIIISKDFKDEVKNQESVRNENKSSYKGKTYDHAWYQLTHTNHIDRQNSKILWWNLRTWSYLCINGILLLSAFVFLLILFISPFVNNKKVKNNPTIQTIIENIKHQDSIIMRQFENIEQKYDIMQKQINENFDTLKLQNKQQQNTDSVIYSPNVKLKKK